MKVLSPRIVSHPHIHKQIFECADGGSVRLVEIPQAVLHCEAVYLPSYLLYHIIEGHKLFFSGTERWELQPGDTILIRRQAAVSCEARLVDNSAFKALSVHLTQEQLEHFVQQQALPERADCANQNACIISPTPQFNHCLQGLQLLFSPQSQVWEQLISHRIQELFMHLFYAGHSEVRAVCAEVLSGRRREYLEMLTQAISQPMPIEAMAHHMGMSLSAFKREFKAIFAQTPARYLMQRRLERAQQLLLTSSQPVQTIAFGTGFDNPSHFVQAFKRAYGSTPGEYREHWPRLA